jgi:hypothetical protein
VNRPPRIPIVLIVLDVAGVALAALGLAGLFTDAAQNLPFLSNKTVAGLLAAAGFALMTFALGNILRWRKLLAAAEQARAQNATAEQQQK